MWPLIKRTIKDSYITFFIYLGVSVLLLWVFVSIFPSFKDMGDQFSELLKNYPQGLLKVFGYDPDAPIFGSVEAFISLENFSFMYQVYVVGLAVSFASWAIAGQIEKKTMSVLLSLPIERYKIFLAKYLSATFLILLFNFISIYSIIIFAKIYDVSYQTDHYALMFFTSFLFSMAIYSLAMFFSAIFRERGKVIFFTVGIVVAMYALYIVAGLKENLSDLQYVSFFYYYNATSIFVKGIVPDYLYLAFGGTTILFGFLSYLIFTRRDISV